MMAEASDRDIMALPPSALGPKGGTDPFLIQGPAVISFSGGRTSAYMLWRILQAHGGTLPEDVVVCFTNTGREMPATLDFVRDCGAAWGVHVQWLEYRRDPETGHAWSEPVSHNSASRAGEPFEMMLAGKQMLPNPVMRFCTTELKIRTIKRWVRAKLGWEHWNNVVGLRHDEPKRVARNRKKNRRLRDRWTMHMPLDDAGIRKADVMAFWKHQPFDLRLAGEWEGNCDGCFLKRRAAVARMFRDHPERMAWWPMIEQTCSSKGAIDPAVALFRKDRPSYEKLRVMEHDQDRLNLAPDDDGADLFICDTGCGA